MGYKPTDEQVAVLDAFRTGGNVSVSAYAGAGKTSTLVDAAAEHPNRRGIFTAFNKKIIEDSSKKFGRNVRCQTSHALASHVLMADGGWRRGRLRAPRVYGLKLAKLLKINDPVFLDGGRTLSPSRLGSLALMMVDRYALSGDDQIAWWHLPSVPGLDDRDSRKIIGTALVPAARIAWANATSEHGTLRYTHNYYRKEFALTHPRIDCDFIMVDEAQDSAGVFIRLLLDQQEYGTQIITVGDSYQAINGWAGAVDAMDKFEGERLLLTQSFRFGPAIAEEANKWLELLGAPKAMRGFDAVQSTIAKDMTPDAVLCRTNGAVVSEVIDRLTKGEKIAMLGDPREVTDFTRGARDLMDKNWSSHPDLMAFGSWGQVQEYVDHDEAGADLKVMVDMIDQHGVDVIEAAMGRLSTPARADVVLSTAHKCKGAEWSRVRIGPDFKAPKPDESGHRKVAREAAMLNYVAITRAKNVLDRGSLSWVDEVLAEHRTARRAHLGPEDDPSVVARFRHDATELRAGDSLGPHKVIETGDGQLATIMPLDLDTLDQRPAPVRRMLTEFATTPIAVPVEPQWVKDGLPGAGWIKEEWEAVQAAADARFDESVAIAAHGSPAEQVARFGAPLPENLGRQLVSAAASGLEMHELVAAPAAPVAPTVEDRANEFEAPVDPLIAETAPVAPKAVLTDEDLANLAMEWGSDPKRPGSCGAKHRSWMNTYCLLDPHSPEHPHRVQGISWDDSQCSEPGVAPAHA